MIHHFREVRAGTQAGNHTTHIVKRKEGGREEEGKEVGTDIAMETRICVGGRKGTNGSYVRENGRRESILMLCFG